jgi:hypothetical protein
MKNQVSKLMQHVEDKFNTDTEILRKKFLEIKRPIVKKKQKTSIESLANRLGQLEVRLGGGLKDKVDKLEYSKRK